MNSLDQLLYDLHEGMMFSAQRGVYTYTRLRKWAWVQVGAFGTLGFLEMVIVFASQEWWLFATGFLFLAVAVLEGWLAVRVYPRLITGYRTGEADAREEMRKIMEGSTADA